MTSVFVHGQTPDEFKIDLIKATNPLFSESDLKNLFSKYSNWINSQSGTGYLMAQLKGREVKPYPLAEFMSDSTYKDKIEHLFNSDNEYHRLFSYLVIAGANDVNYELNLVDRLKNETNEINKFWAGRSLLHMRTHYTTPLFEFMIDHEDFGDAHLLPLYFQLNKDSLQSTAYKKINSEDIKSKILAVQLLSKTERNPKTDKLIISAIKNWDISIKGYAIYSAKELQIGNLKELMLPLLNNSETRQIAIQALANSPTEEDLNYLKEIAVQKDTIPKEILNGFFESKNIQSVKFWLQVIREEVIPENYYFHMERQPLIYSDKLLEDVQKTLKIIKNSDVQQYLIKAIKERQDSESRDIILNYLENSNSSVRYFTASILKDSVSEEVVKKLVEIIKDPEKRVSSITHVLVENKIDTLQRTYLDIYNTSENEEWKNSAIEYLANFPNDKAKNIFLRILNQENEQYILNRYAALGLANLDALSPIVIGRIIEISEKERLGSDGNCLIYLKALSKSDHPKAVNYIRSFEGSESELIQKKVNEFLEN